MLLPGGERWCLVSPRGRPFVVVSVAVAESCIPGCDVGAMLVTMRLECNYETLLMVLLLLLMLLL